MSLRSPRRDRWALALLTIALAVCAASAGSVFKGPEASAPGAGEAGRPKDAAKSPQLPLNFPPSAVPQTSAGARTPEAASSGRVSELAKDLADDLSVASDGQGAPADGQAAGQRIQEKLSSEPSGGGAEPELPNEVYAPQPAPALGTGGVVRAPVAHPGRYYDHAWTEAVYLAGRKGVPRAGVAFMETAGSIPADAWGAHLLYTFRAEAANGKVWLIYVDFAPRWAVPGQGMGLRAMMALAPQAARPVVIGDANLPGPAIKAMRASPETALRLAREQAPTLSASVSFSLRPAADGAWYRFYDSGGGDVAVNARTGRAIVYKAPSIRSSQSQYLAVTRAAMSIVRRIARIRPTVNEKDIQAAVAQAVAQKGYPWSQTEYDAHRAMVAYDLQRHGATKTQLAEFYQRTDAAPIKNGRFNPYAGD